MRTTITIDDDVLTAARAIARQRNQLVDRIVSELARQSLRPSAAEAERNGVPLPPVRDNGVIVTLDIVNALRGELLLIGAYRQRPSAAARRHCTLLAAMDNGGFWDWPAASPAPYPRNGRGQPYLQ